MLEDNYTNQLEDQEVAEDTTGVSQTEEIPSYSPPEIPQDVQATPGEEYMTEETSVVSQLGKILDQDSEYIQRARKSGKELAQRSGALGTSMGAAASQGLAIDKGGELASKEAEIASRFKLGEQQATATQKQTAYEGIVSGKLNEQEAGIQERQTKINQLFESGESALAREHQANLQESEQLFQKDLEVTMQGMRDSMDKLKMSHEEEIVARQHVNNIMENHQIAVESIMSNAELLSTLGDQLPDMMATLRQSTIAAINFTVTSNNLSGELSHLADLEDNWDFSESALDTE